MAIEFAAIFGLFFALVYGTIAFGFPAVTRMGFQHYAVEAARAAVQVDTSLETTQFARLVSQQVTNQITAGWLPTQWRDGCSAPNDGNIWTPLPPHNGEPSYGYFQAEANAPTSGALRYRLYVCIQANTPIVPQLVLTNDLRFPPHEGANGNPWVRGYTMTTF